MKKERPVNLDLTSFKFPLTALLSITHRATGVFLFVGVALLMCLLDHSLSSAQGFADAKQWLTSGGAQFALWVVLAALAYHLVAGVKHLFMDVGIGESLEGGQLASRISLIAAIVLIILVGVWVW